MGRQAENIKLALEDINEINTGKKRKDALGLYIYGGYQPCKQANIIYA